MNFITRFISNRIKEFCDIYQDDKSIRESYGHEYADRFSAVDPVTGKKKISVMKIAKRIVIVIIVAIFAIIFFRMMTYESIWK